jgi:hypothetical protein
MRILRRKLRCDTAYFKPLIFSPDVLNKESCTNFRKQTFQNSKSDTEQALRGKSTKGRSALVDEVLYYQVGLVVKCMHGGF